MVRRRIRQSGANLSPEAIALIRAARLANEPSQADRDRLRAALAIALSLCWVGQRRREES
jgi:hypothetical protein